MNAISSSLGKRATSTEPVFVRRLACRPRTPDTRRFGYCTELIVCRPSRKQQQHSANGVIEQCDLVDQMLIKQELHEMFNEMLRRRIIRTVDQGATYCVKFRIRRSQSM